MTGREVRARAMRAALGNTPRADELTEEELCRLHRRVTRSIRKSLTDAQQAAQYRRRG